MHALRCTASCCGVTRYTRPTVIAQMASDVSGRNLPPLSPLPDDSLFTNYTGTGSEHGSGGGSSYSGGGGAAASGGATVLGGAAVEPVAAWKQQPARRYPEVMVMQYDSSTRAPSVSINHDAALNRNMALSAYFCRSSGGSSSSTSAAGSGGGSGGLGNQSQTRHADVSARGQWLALSAQQPYVVPFSAVGLSFTHSERVPRSEILRVLNASIVGLMKPVKVHNGPPPTWIRARILMGHSGPPS